MKRWLKMKVGSIRFRLISKLLGNELEIFYSNTNECEWRILDPVKRSPHGTWKSEIIKDPYRTTIKLTRISLFN